MTDLFVHTSYYFIGFLFLCWALFLGHFLKKIHFSPTIFFRSYWPGMCSALLLSLFVFYTVPIGYKILNDETLLLSISNSMYQRHDVDCAVMVLDFGGYEVLETLIPKRPLLFPFFVSTFHTLFGFQEWNVFAVNFVVLFLTLSAVYIACRQFLGNMPAVAAQFFVLSYPVFTITATSGGYDLLSLFFFITSLAIFYGYLRKPGPELLALLWLNLMMFANIRYESIVFICIISAISLGSAKFSYIRKYVGIYLLSPLFFLPFIWQRLLSQGKYENPGDVALFSVGSFKNYLSLYIENLMNLDMYLPYNGFLNIFAFIVCCVVGGAIIQKKVMHTHWQKRFWLTVIACLVVHLIIILSHHFGRYDEPSQARLFLFSSFFFAMTPILLWVVFKRTSPGLGILALSVLLFFVYHPIAMESKIMNSLVLPRSFADGRKILTKIEQDNITVITYSPIMYTSLGYGSVDFRYANQYKERLKQGLQKAGRNKIISFQMVDADSKIPLTGQELNQDFVLETLVERFFSDNIVMRVSSVSF